MFKILLRSLVLFSLYHSLDAAQASVNAKLTSVCGVEIYVYTNAGVANYAKCAGASVVQKSSWVSRAVTNMNGNLVVYVTEAAKVNNNYQTGNNYLASTPMRDAIARIVDVLGYASWVGTTAQVSDASYWSGEISSVCSTLTSIRNDLQQYTVFNLLTSWALMSSKLSDSQVSSLSGALLRGAKAMKGLSDSFSNKVINDNSFKLLAAALDFQEAKQAGNNALVNTALTAQTSFYEGIVAVSTSSAYTALNVNKLVFDGYTTSIILEFNGFGGYAQIAVNVLNGAEITSLVGADVVSSVYEPLSQNFLVGLQYAYITVNQQFLQAIQDCDNVIESTTAGENGSNSAGASGMTQDPNPYSLKGEVKKCQARGFGLMLGMQNQYGKSWSASTCGAFSINTIIGQVGAAQTSCNSCATKLVFRFRAVLDQVKKIIQSQIDANLAAMKACAVKAKAAKDAGGSAADVSTTCTDSDVDITFAQVTSQGGALVAKLQTGGEYNVEATNCRKSVRSDLKSKLLNTKASFVKCAGISNF